jgi:hypothetical protein
MYVVATELAHCMMDMNEDLLSLMWPWEVVSERRFAERISLQKTRNFVYVWVCFSSFSYSIVFFESITPP